MLIWLCIYGNEHQIPKPADYLELQRLGMLVGRGDNMIEPLDSRNLTALVHVDDDVYCRKVEHAKYLLNQDRNLLHERGYIRSNDGASCILAMSLG